MGKITTSELGGISIDEIKKLNQKQKTLKSDVIR